MGCDIHIIMQRRHKGIWVPVDPPPPMDPRPKYNTPEYDLDFGRYVEPPPDVELLSQSILPLEDRIPSRIADWCFDRDYPAFGVIAGVRGAGPPVAEQKGWPADFGDNPFEDWCHSPTWFGCDEFITLCRRHKALREDTRWRGLRDAMKDIAVRYGITHADVRMVICFDN